MIKKTNSTRVWLNYSLYILRQNLRTKSFWGCLFLYCFGIIMPAIAVPITAKINPLSTWISSIYPIGQTLLCFAVSLFCAVLAINIFKESYDDGTELIICSKQLNRPMMISVKLFAFLIYCIGINLIGCIVLCLDFAIPNFDMKYAGGLIFSMFIGNCVSFLFYGSIGILFVIKFNKIITILLNMLVALLLFIHQILVLYAYHPANKIMLDQDSSGVITYLLPSRKYNSDTNTFSNKIDKNYAANFTFANRYLPILEKANADSVKDYWKNVLDRQYSSKLIITDIATHIGYSYMCYGNAYNYAQMTANQNFSYISSQNFYLDCPISKDIVGNEQNGLDWLFGSETTSVEPGTNVVLSFPSSVVMAGCDNSSAAVLKHGTVDIWPIGYINNPITGSKDYVLLEANDWDKYYQGFCELYDNVFSHELIVKNQPDVFYYSRPATVVNYKLASNWSSSQDNISKYYQLIWYSLLGRANEIVDNWKGSNGESHQSFKDFNISSALDLNKRYIQFKNFCYYKELANQQKLIDIGKTEWEINPGTSDAEKTAWKNANDFYQSKSIVFHEEIVKIDGKNKWYVVPGDGSGKKKYQYTELVQQGTKMFNFTIARYAASLMEEDSTCLQDDIINCTYSQMLKSMSIVKNVISCSESYLFTKIDNYDSLARSGSWTANHYTVSTSYLPYMTTKEMKVGQNMTWFKYTSKPKVPYYAYVIFWSMFSLLLLGCSTIILIKFDVK